ncbi:hypothetical protein A2Z22_00845 [Candidatus Woesebacteria bacterium RBG_16_34_12]|uniref:Uncharacterized protein n=1 Tax=Candidatus Woesebacteria bacterium RBG_16_34_12 TaxID=1802480 RepID=A0A1F7X8Q2_9BACT|nr:MAG: hypothetical protein A2Z22_00845 [Candidatus Woesebacteria bacterium RBG_16_34_12]
MQPEREEICTDSSWQTLEHPGYSGKKKDEQIKEWDRKYGEGNWRIAWELRNGEVLDFNGVFWKVYVLGYIMYFIKNPDEARLLTENYSYAYDKDMISPKEAFDPQSLYNKQGRANQFHHVALNIALEWYLGMPFRGDRPIQVREGKPGAPFDQWPEGFRWSPGRIPTVVPNLIPDVNVEGWWESCSIEDLYQKSKVLQIRVK